MDLVSKHWKQMEFDCCAFCGGDDYLMGPTAALSINFKYAGCGAT